MAVERRKSLHVEELNLVPIMNLVTILIPFLLMAAEFVHLAVIDSTLPAIGKPEVVEQDPNEKPPLVLSVHITDEGLTIAGADHVLNPQEAGAEAPEKEEDKGPTIPCKETPCAGVDSYDWAELTRLLNLIKDEYPDDENVSLVPESDIRYEVIVKVMDYTREDREKKDKDGKPRLLFPYVVIAGGAQ